MPDFSYTAADEDGNIVNETIHSISEEGVVKLLHNKNLVPIRISPAHRTGFSDVFTKRVGFSILSKKVNRRNLIHFTQDLATLIEAGLPMDRSLNTLSSVGYNEHFVEILNTINNDIQSGSYLSEAITKHPEMFSSYYINMVRAGEAGGVLERVLERLGQFLEDSQDLVDTIISESIYPFFLVLVSGLSVILLMTLVIPRFTVIFSDMEFAIPFSARLLMGASSFIIDYGLVAVLLFPIAAYCFLQYRKTPEGRWAVDRLILKTPIISTLIREIETTRLTRALGILIQNRVPILSALTLVKDISQNRIIKDALDDVYQSVKEGARITEPLMNSGHFPEIALQMMAVGEETGELDIMLIRISDNYEKKVKKKLKQFAGLFEPAVILIIGIIVGFVVISMINAVFSIYDIPF